MSRPESLKPAYNFVSLSEPVILSQGPVVANLDGTAYPGAADLLIQFIPSPSLFFHANLQAEKTSPFAFAYKELTKSSFLFSGLEIDGFCGARRVLENFKNWELDWHPKYEPVELDDMSSKTSVTAIFHLFNFPDFQGGQHQDTAPARCPLLILESEEWKIYIQALPDGATREAWNRIKAENGCFLTHMVKLERKDGELFSGDDASEQCHLLNSFLSFAKGGRCTPVCGVGFDAAGATTWKNFAAPPVSKPHYSWFTPFKGCQLEFLFPLFAKCWQQSEEWKNCLSTAIYWYTQANAGGGSLDIYGAIILAQSALERLAHHYLVVDRKMISAKGFDDLRASDRLRMLFAVCGIPNEIMDLTPDICQANDSFKKNSKWMDAPHAITDIRNELVHPVKKKEVDDCFLDAWKLSLWYLELSILAMCGYDGTYTSRLTAKCANESETVPWGKK